MLRPCPTTLAWRRGSSLQVQGQVSTGQSEGGDLSLAIQCCSEDAMCTGPPRSRPASPRVSQVGGAGFSFQGVQGKQKHLERKRQPRSAFQTLPHRHPRGGFCH